MEFTFNDGGRAAAGFKGNTGDCVVRAIAIATGMPYQQVYDDLFELARAKASKKKKARGVSPRTGVERRVYETYLKQHGWKWHPTMQIGSGCKVHLVADELPRGSIICRLSRHLTTVIDGVIHDTYDPSREAHNIRILRDDEPLKPGEWELEGEGGIIVNGVRPRQAACIQRRCVYGYFAKDGA